MKLNDQRGDFDEQHTQWVRPMASEMLVCKWTIFIQFILSLEAI